MSGSAPSVAHLVGTHLAFSETFLDRQFRAWKRYAPWVYAGRIDHPDKFPPERVDVPPSGMFARAWGATVGVHYAPWFLSRMRSRGTVVAHAHYGITGANALPLVWLERLPLVVSFYGYDVAYLGAPWRHPGYAKYFALFPLLVRAASRLLVVSESLREELAAAGAPAAKIEVHRTGIDTAHFSPDAAAAARDEPTVVLSGREVEKKGFAYGFEALARLRARGRRFRVLFHGTGNGPLREALARQVATLGLGGMVDVLRPDEPTRDVLRRSDVILAPSVTAANGDREGLPTVLVEAAACGVPAVASSHAGIPELVADGESGLLCAERDVAGLETALDRLLGEPALRRRMGESARARAVEGWDAERLLERREAIYDEVR